MRHHESRLQTSLVKAIRSIFPAARNIFAVPNGGVRSIATARRLKGEGVLAGVPDLFLPVAKGEYHGLFLEVKTETGRLSPSQTEICEYLRGEGYRVEIVRSVAEGIELVSTYLCSKRN